MRNWGLTLLAIWLIVTGLSSRLAGTPYLDQILAALAIAAGILILMRR